MFFANLRFIKIKSLKKFYLLTVLILLRCYDEVSMQAFDDAEIMKTIVLLKLINET